jgi:hypothetical protein
MNDRSELKSHGAKAWNTGRTKRKAEKNNGDPKLNQKYIKKQHGACLSEQILNCTMSGIASKS